MDTRVAGAMGGKIGGRSRSERKVAAARTNGKLGGRRAARRDEENKPIALPVVQQPTAEKTATVRLPLLFIPKEESK